MKFSQAIHSCITLHPDVVDRAGRPVTDLKLSDFTVLEDGVPQQVRSFAPQAFDAGTAPPDTTPALRKGIALAPQHGRMFVILLGQGRSTIRRDTSPACCDS